MVLDIFLGYNHGFVWIFLDDLRPLKVRPLYNPQDLVDMWGHHGRFNHLGGMVALQVIQHIHGRIAGWRGGEANK